MPREIVSHTAPKAHTTLPQNEWVKKYFVPESYSCTRVAVIEQTGQKQREDFSYRAVSVGGDFSKTRSCDTIPEHLLILLALPIVTDIVTDNDAIQKIIWLKLSDDERFCNARSGIQSQPSWCHCVHADYSRACDLIFSATKPGEDFRLQLSVAISVLETIRYFSNVIPEVKELSRNIFDLPQVSDTMQKYIASIVLSEEYSSQELLTMVQTAINRNLKWNAQDLHSTAAMLILLPMVKRLFSNTTETSVSRQNAVSRVHREYVAKLESFDLDVKYQSSQNATQSDNWNVSKQARTSLGQINSRWINTLCMLAANFEVNQLLVEELRQELQDATGKVVFKFKLPNHQVSWILNRSDQLRLVKIDGQGARAAGLSIHTRCYLMLSPDSRACAQFYSVDLQTLSEGGGTISLSSNLDVRATTRMLPKIPILIEMRKFDTVIKQGNVEFTLKGRRVNIQFCGGYLTMKPLDPCTIGLIIKGCAADETCAICLLNTEPSHIKYITKCKHTYHKLCIDKWINHCNTGSIVPTCPMCRRGI